MPRVAIIDHGLGNLQAVEKPLIKAGGGAAVFRCYDIDQLRRADAVVLPGGGRLDACVAELRRLGIAAILRDLMRQRPLLAIGVGLHALGRAGLGLLDFDSVPLNADGTREMRLPHMGWNRVHRHGVAALWQGVPQDAWFYFAHRMRIEAPAAMVAA